MCSVSKSVTQHVFSSSLLLSLFVFHFVQNLAKMLAIFFAKKELLRCQAWLKKDANYPDIDISFHITTFMWIRNGNWQHLLIVILGKHQLNAYKYYSIPVLILMSIKLLSSHFRQLHASDCPTFCVWQAVSESLWETILQRRAEAFHNSHGVPIPWNLLEFTSPLSDNTARAQNLSSTIFMCKRTMLIVLDYLNKYG